MNKRIVVKLLGNALEEYGRLKDIVLDEIARNCTSSKQQTLLRSIENKKELLKQNYTAGTQKSRKKIPKVLIERYNPPNLWKINLADHWRMLYTVRAPTEIEICDAVVNILEIIDHGHYDKLFGYRKR